MCQMGGREDKEHPPTEDLVTKGEGSQGEKFHFNIQLQKQVCLIVPPSLTIKWINATLHTDNEFLFATLVVDPI